MLRELRVENLLLIERAELALGPGLTVLTGETGAGKTVLAHALDLLLGGRARGGIVRPGAAEAYVEGTFELRGDVRELAGERLAQDAAEVVLARRVWADGRTRAYLNGRSSTIADVRELGEALLAFYGQHEHRRLTLASAQLEALDGFAGPRQREHRDACAVVHGEVRSLERELEQIATLAGAREREIDLLRFELDEIEAAAPSADEADELRAERERLLHLETLRGAALAAAEAIAPQSAAAGDAGAGAGPLLAEAARALDDAAGVDRELDALGERARALAVEAEDLAAELRRYEEGVEGEPGRLAQVEERLEALSRLERKHGGTLAGALAHAERCRERLGEVEGAEASLESARERLRSARERRDGLASELHEARAAAAPRLAAAVREALAELAMEGASFDVRLERRDEPGPTGSDGVDFLIAANAGVAAGPLREIASGGELSRVMLALLGVAHSGRDGGRLLVFDEVDAGIGGQTARAVGARLRALAEGRQVLCITHLPQIASVADHHFRVAKDPTPEPAMATVEPLRGEGVVGELVRMLGADDGDGAAKRHARELLKAAA